MAKSNAGTIGIIALFALILAGGVYFVLTKPPGVAPEQALAPKSSDIGLGDPNAPIKMIEYASLDCPHCADLATEVMPQIKSAYIDTGKVYYVMRDSPRSDISAVAAMVARCAAKDKFYAVTDMLFANQAHWLGQDVANKKDALYSLFQRAGVTADQIKSCVTQENLDSIQRIQDEAVKALHLSGVPMIFINGEEFKSARTFENFDAKFKELLGAAATPASAPAPASTP